MYFNYKNTERRTGIRDEKIQLEHSRTMRIKTTKGWRERRAGKPPTVLERPRSKVLGSLYTRTLNCAINCCPISSRLITIRLKVRPFNINIIQVYAPTRYTDDDTEDFFSKNWTKNIIVAHGDWNAKIKGDEYVID